MLVPIAAAGLTLTMVGALLTHITRVEEFIPALVIMLLAIFVTFARKDLLLNPSKELDVELS